MPQSKGIKKVNKSNTKEKNEFVGILTLSIVIGVATGMIIGLLMMFTLVK